MSNVNNQNNRLINEKLEINNMEIKDNRNRIQMIYTKERKELRKKLNLSNKDTNDNMFILGENKDQNIKNYLNKQIFEIGFQNSAKINNISTQTPFFKKNNKIIQTEFKVEEKVLNENDIDNLLSFLNNVGYLIEEALTGNETVDIFYDDLNFNLENENNKETKTTELSIIEELKSYEYETSKGKIVSCVKFQPHVNNYPSLLAISFIEPLTFKERIVMSCRSYQNQIFLWDYTDIHLFNPIAILNSPLEILKIEFKPNNPNILLGIAINGQIILWDLKNKIVKKSSKNNKKKENEEILQIDAVLISALQEVYSIPPTIPIDTYSKKNTFSHKNPILNIEFLPPNMEIDKKNPLNLIRKTEYEYNQFCTFSCDGQLLFWDLRFQEKDSRGKSFIKENGEIEYSLLVWKAIFSVQLFKPENNGVMNGSYFTFKKGVDFPLILGASDEGEIFNVDYLAKPLEDLSKVETIKKVWNCHKNGRFLLNLEYSPYFNDIFLSIQELNFYIWKENCDKPIFISPTCEFCKITCGSWSPSRPGVIFIGKTDGMVDIWDFLDQTNSPTQQHLVAASGVYSFKINEIDTNLFAVGDRDGCLHLLSLPKNITKKINKEEELVYDYFLNEEKRVNYYQEIFYNLEEEKKRQQQENYNLQNSEKEMIYQEDFKEKKNEKNEIEDLYKKIYNQFYGISEIIATEESN